MTGRTRTRATSPTTMAARLALAGVAVSLVAVYEGYHSEPTPEGVGLATTRTVVISSVLVLVLNYLLTAAFLTTK